jgi:nucleoprotein TPR
VTLEQQTNQQKITALENEKKDATAKQQEAINVAVTKARSEVQTPDSSVTNEQMVKRHAEELEALEARLKAAHKNEIDVAVAAARQAASASTSASAEAQKAAIEAAVTAAKSEWAKGQEEALEQAVERGRMEQATKARIKDSQLLKSQTRVKDLEAQLLKLQSSNGTPESAASATASTSQAPPVAAAAQAKLPSRPAGVGPATRGRGAARTLSAALGGRGGAPAPAAALAQPASGVSIMGAAKRPREEGEVEAPPPENSLAKRLKPAEAKPVPIRRPGAPKPQ